MVLYFTRDHCSSTVFTQNNVVVLRRVYFTRDQCSSSAGYCILRDNSVVVVQGCVFTKISVVVARGEINVVVVVRGAVFYVRLVL